MCEFQTGIELIKIYYGAGDLEKAAHVVGVLRQFRPSAGEPMLSIAMSAPESARMHQVMAQELARQDKTRACQSKPLRREPN
jgi:hypothetical protein